MPNPVKKFFKKRGAQLKKGISKYLPGSQRVVIPKGTINPDETTVIEIPSNLQSRDVVVARPKLSSFSEARAGMTPMWKKDYYPVGDDPQNRRTFPPKKIKHQGEFYDEGYTYGGWQNEASDFSYSSDPGPVSSPDYATAQFDDPSMYQGFAPNLASSPVESPAEYMSAMSRQGPGPDQRDIQFMLDRVELVETDKIQKDLREYQTARRRLIFDATNLASVKETLVQSFRG